MRIDKTVINVMNKSNILQIVRDQSPVFKAEIARLCNLSIPTVMKITDELIDRGLVRKVGKGEISRGKPPEMLEFVADRYFIIGVDVGTTFISTIIMDLSARVLNRYMTPTHVEQRPDEVIGRIIDSLRFIISNSNVDESKILGIGIGMPGLLDSEAGVVLFSPDFGWENINLLKPIRNVFSMPIVMENVTRAMAMGEKWFGAGRNTDIFLYINLGFGIGSAIMIDGELFRGFSGKAGELGHMTVERNGPLCNCGNYGCLEALASANAISKQAKLSIKNGRQSSILELANGDPDKIEAKTVFDAAKNGDALALEIVMQAIEYLGVAIASATNLLEPGLIILEGGVTNAGDILIDNLQKVLNCHTMRYVGRHTRIIFSHMDDNAAAIGAASFLVKRLFEYGGNAEELKI